MQLSAAGMARAFAWAGIVLGLVYLTVAGGGGFFGLYSTALRAFSVAILSGALLIWLVVAVRNPAWRPRSTLAPALAVCLGAMALSWVLSDTPRLGTDFVAYGLLLFGAYLLLVRLLDDRFFGPRIEGLGALIGLALCVIYMAAVLRHWLDFWAQLGRFSPPPLRPMFEGLSYGNPSTVATVVMLSWLAAAAHFGFTTSRRRWFLLAFGGLVAVVVFVSGSRGAWVGLAVAAVIVGPLAFFLEVDRKSLKTFAARRDVWVGGVLILAAGVLAGIVFLPAVISRLSEPASETRSAFFAASVRMFQDRPLTGQGPGTWVPERAWFTQPHEADYYIPHAHNIVLQTVAELGLTGVIAGLVLAAALALIVVRGLRSQDVMTRRFAWASLFGLVYLLGHQMFDFYPNMPAVGFFLALSVARLDGLVQSPKRLKYPSPRRNVAVAAAAVAISVSVVVSAGWLLRHEAIAADADRAALAANGNDWSTALARARRVAEADPDMPPYAFLVGLAAAHNGDLTLARDQMLKSAQADGFPIAWLNVAKLELDLGNDDAARAALHEAMRLGWQSPQIGVGAAEMWLQLKDEAAAINAAASALAVAPGLASDPYWHSDPEIERVWSRALPVAYSRAPATFAYVIAAEAGDGDAAARLAAAVPGEERHVASLFTAAWAGDRGAFEELHAIARSDPLHDEWVALCRRVAARSHDDDWPHDPYSCDGAGTPLALSVVRVGPPLDGIVMLPGPGMSFHFQYGYRRYAPFDQLVPGVPHLRAIVV